jgi:competence protein ComEC
VVATLVAPVSERLAAVVGWLAGRAAWWIVTVAEHGARLPGAAVPWPATPGRLVLLALLCLAATLAMARLLTRPRWAVPVAVLVVVAVLRPVGPLGWPPPGWVMVACDVGQGDALVLNAGHRAAVVVDAGPDPDAVDRCLDRLDVDAVPLVVLSHLHADHAAGLDGVDDGRSVAEVEVGALSTPADQLRSLALWADREDVPVRRAVYGEQRRLGRLSWRVIAPDTRLPLPRTADGDESGDENNASLVLLVEHSGLRLLLTGDVEPEAQRALLRSGADVRADVLKVPHHGSRYQDPQFAAAVGAEVALLSAGADNDYGHPADETLDLLRRSGAATYRTDLAGDVAVVWSGGRLDVQTEHQR